MSTNTNNWELFFDGHAPHYMENGFTQNTIYEVDFIVEQLHLVAGNTILDIGCGTGRHSIELAKRGYQVTGVDISAGMLAEAKKAADLAGVHVNWVKSDAVKYEATECYDAVICLCEGAFGLVGREEDPFEHDTAILKNVSKALKAQGRFILTTLNAYAAIRRLTQEDVASGKFNPLTMVEHYMDELDLPEGKKTVEVRERRYFPFELRQLCADAGMKVEHIWGGTAGNWNRQSIHLDEIEVMIVAVK